MTLDPAWVEDASGYRGHADRLFCPASEDEVAEILAAAAGDGVSVTIAGAGTGLSGGRVAEGGWVVSLENFRRLEIGPGMARVGAGVLLRDLHAAAGRTGQFYGPDPTETTASIGGNVATNASGSRSLRYGDTRRNALALRSVLMDGRRLAVGRGDRLDFPVHPVRKPGTTKHAAGFLLEPGMDWIDLLVGSEGTLGVVTEVELRLRPRPASVLAGVVFFDTEVDVLDAVDAWRGLDGIRMLEYFDAGSLELLRRLHPETPRRVAALLLEQESDDIEAWPARLEEFHADPGASWFAVSEADRERFRRFRHALPEAVNDTVRRHGFLKLGSDCAVPLERNREMMAYYRRRVEERFPGRSVIFGHIGDAHLHVNILPASREEFDLGQELMLEFARHAVVLGGTVSAEHGLGKRKRHLLAIQCAPEEIEAMREVKRRLDPRWLLGRGNLFLE